MPLRSRLKSTWHDPVWSKVIAAALLATAGAAWAWRNALAVLVLAAVTNTRDTVIAVYRWFFAPTQLTHFEIMLSALIVVAIAGFTRRGFRRTDTHLRHNYVNLNQRLLKFESPQTSDSADTETFALTPPRCRALLALLDRVDRFTSLDVLHKSVVQNRTHVDWNTTKAHLQRDMEEAERAGIVSSDAVDDHARHYTLTVPSGRDWVLSKEEELKAQALDGMTARGRRTPY